MKRLALWLLLLVLTVPAVSEAAYESLGRREDDSHVSGEVGVASLCVRQDALINSTSTDGDYANCKVTQAGRLYVSSTLDASIPAGSNTIGALVANQSVNVAQMNGITITMGNGISGTGVQRFTLASDSTGNIATIGTSITPGSAATNLGKAEDAAHATGHVGVMNLCVRQATPTDLSAGGTDLDYEPCEVDATGRLHVNTEMPDAAALADNMANPTVPGVSAFLMCFDGTTWDRCLMGLTDTDDDSIAFAQVPALVINQNLVSDGASWVRRRVYLEDVSSVGAEQLTLAGTIRQDVPAGTTTTDGDYQNLKTDSIGRLWVNCGTGCAGGTQFAEDAASANGDVGTLAMARRTATPANTSGTDLDYEVLQMSAGRLWVSATIDAALPTGTNVIGALTANQSVNVAQMNGVTVLMGNGASGTGAQRVTLADNSTGTIRVWDGTDIALVDGSGNLAVSCANCSGSGVSANEDTASADGHPGTPAYSVRQDTISALTSTDGDYQPLKSTASGRLYTSAIVETNVIEDAGETVGGTGPMVLSVRRDTQASSAGTTGDNATFNTDATGNLWITGTVLEDVAETVGGTGHSILGVRRDTQASSAGTSGDYATLNLDATGNLWVSGTVLEDAAETVGGAGHSVLSVRRDTLATSAGTSGDNATFNTNSLGALYTQATAGPSGGSTTHYFTSAASTNSTNVKASAGNVYTLSAVNTTGTLVYLRMYNLSSAPTCSSATGFVESVPVPAATTGAGIVRDVSVGQTYSTGIGYCLTGGGSSTDNTAAVTGVYVTLLYN